MYVYDYGLADPRKGNFKMNGTVESTKKIIDGLNSAKLDPNTGSSNSDLIMIIC